MNDIPRPEHPQPQMEREHWQNLNGEWEFAIDFGKSGVDRRYYDREHLEEKIFVPFCPESELSGIGYKDFMPALWYQKNIGITEEELSGRVLLHFGAVDYECIIYVNGVSCGTHKGGYASFTVDITDELERGENRLTVAVSDDLRSGLQPKGKQSGLFYSHGCDYTRTTGIWQTVWLEFVPESYIKNVRYFPNISDGSVTIQADTCGAGMLTAKAFYKGKLCGESKSEVSSGQTSMLIKLSEIHLWEPGDGKLYDMELQFENDKVKSYFGLREITINGYSVEINGKSVFQRLVLDQGFYPDGIYTAPSDEALIRNIRLSMEAGFNGARLHEKVFEPRFLYHCDQMGYMVWGEMANWGLDLSSYRGYEGFIPEWMEVLQRDFNHPAIIGWCPFNETWDTGRRKQVDGILALTYQVTKACDPTRPCIDTSGNFHVITDIYDVHDYEQDVDKFREHYEKFKNGTGAFRDEHGDRQHYTKGLPMFVSEYGGIKWAPEAKENNAWGYGEGPKSEEEFLERYQGLTDVLLDNPKMFGFCYTQLTDVEQEVNGIYYYNREPKFDTKKLYKINSRKAAIEKQDN